MSGVGFSELLILFLIGLIVLGPERLPKVANQMGTWLGQARRMTRVMKRQLEEELNLEGDVRSASPYPRSRAEQFAAKAQPGPTPMTATPPPASEADDSYSPAHSADQPGTGVGDATVDGGEPPAADEGVTAGAAEQDKDKAQ